MQNYGLTGPSNAGPLRPYCLWMQGTAGKEEPLSSVLEDPGEGLPAGAGGSGAGHDPRKRRQIIDGARAVFLARGFDGASMEDVARAAGVSKGTLYVYFENKEQLFAALIEEESEQQAERLFRLDPADGDVRAVLTRLGLGFIEVMTSPGKLSSVRVVIGIAERMRDIGEDFYRVGPCEGVRKLKTYLDAQVTAGALHIPDTEHAAAQFLDLCLTGVMKPLLFGVKLDIDEARKRAVIDSAVTMFLAAYGKRG